MPLSRYRGTRRSNVLRRRRYKRKATVTRKRNYPRRIIRAVGVPKQAYAKLRYMNFTEFNLAAGAANYTKFRLNSLFDPEVALGGGQPYYHDQWSALFARYRVYGCKVEVTLSCSSSSTNLFHPTVVLLSFADSTPLWSNQITASCSKRAIRRQLIPGQQVVTLKKYYDLAAVAGVSKWEYNNVEVFQALCTADPARTIQCEINFENNDGTATLTVTQTTRLTYYVKYFDTTEPTAS